MQQLNRNLRGEKVEMYVVICLLIVDAGLGAIRTTVKNISSRVHVVKRCAARAAEEWRDREIDEVSLRCTR